MKALVTGGGGFLGFKIVRQLIDQGYEVTTFSRQAYAKLTKLNVKHIIGDISDYEEVHKACINQDIVFHTAAIAGIDGAYKIYYQINYIGTKNIIMACHSQKVKKLIYTSSPSVAYNLEDIKGADETIGYAKSYVSAYAETKALAEKLVLSQNQKQLLTCAIRPHLIWGEEDNHLIPKLVELSQKKQLKQIGDGKNIVDLTYIDNAAYAHILAEKSLTKNSKLCAQAYFISDLEPIKLWAWINNLLDSLGYEQIEKKIPFQLAYSLGFLCELSQKFLGIPKKLKMNRFIAFQLAKSHYFSNKKAKSHFNYKPIISVEEGLKRVKAYLKK